MIDLDLLRNNLEEVKSNLSKRAFDFDTSLWNELEENRKDLQVQMESYQAEQNTIAKEIGSAQKNKDSIEDLKAKASEISNKLKKVKEKFQTNKIEYDNFLLLQISISKDLQKVFFDKSIMPAGICSIIFSLSYLTV